MSHILSVRATDELRAAGILAEHVRRSRMAFQDCATPDHRLQAHDECGYKVFPNDGCHAAVVARMMRASELSLRSLGYTDEWITAAWTREALDAVGADRP